jgi:hypothetical protein
MLGLGLEEEKWREKIEEDGNDLKLSTRFRLFDD